MSDSIQCAKAQRPSSCWGGARYYRVAVLEVEPGVERVAMISERARGVVRVVRVWDRLYRGGERSAFARAMRDAEELVEELTSAELAGERGLDAR